MNILYYYQKFIKKSRSFFARRKKIDIILFCAAAAVLAVIAVYQISRLINQARRIDICISSQCIELFGKDTVDLLIHEFEEQNPDLRILITAPHNADIVFFDDSEFVKRINNSALVSLAPYIHTEVVSEQWALPLVSFMDLFIYNIDILEAANLDRPPKTRAEFLAGVKAIAESQKDGQKPVFPFALGLSPADPLALRRNFYPWVWANGGDIPLIDISENVTLPRIFTDTVTFLEQLYREELLAPDTLKKTGAQLLEEFAQGKIAMILASARDIAFLQNNAKGFTFGLTAVPATTQGKNRLGLSGVYAGIGSACTLPDTAWFFLAFIAGKSQILAEALNAVPGSPGTFPGEYIVQDPLYSKAWDIFEAAEIVEYMPGQQNEGEVNRLIWEKLIAAFK